MMAVLNSLSGDALRGITPASLSAYARVEGWTKSGEYRRYSDIYSAEGKPEILVPRTTVIDDYDLAVSDLIRVFAREADLGEDAVFYDLKVADRDVVRVGVSGEDYDSLPVESGFALLSRSRDMVLSAACSLDRPARLYRIGSNAVASDYLKQMRFAYMDLGSHEVTLLSPVVPPAQQYSFSEDEPEFPMPRRVTSRLYQSLVAVRNAADQVAVGDAEAFGNAVDFGVSANLCEAVAGLIDGVSPFHVAFSFAITRPVASRYEKVGFDRSYVEILKDAAQGFRVAGPIYDTTLFGFINRLARDEDESPGTVWLRASVDGKVRTVSAVLRQEDYEQAIRAHISKSAVTIKGDLESVGRRLRLDNAVLLGAVGWDDDIEGF